MDFITNNKLDFIDLIALLQRKLEKLGFKVSTKVNDQKIVYKSFIRFSGLLHQLEISDITSIERGSEFLIPKKFGPSRIPEHISLV